MDPESPLHPDRADHGAFEIEVELPPVTSVDVVEDDELEDYLEQLEHALGLIGAYARHEPELTLWCCRRGAELVLRCIHIALGADRLSKRNPTMAQLRGHPLPGDTTLADVLGDSYVVHLNTVQGHGNIGVHARRNGRKHAWSGVVSAVSAMASLVERLFEDDLLGSAEQLLGIQHKLAVVRAGGRSELPSELRIEQLEQEAHTLRTERDQLRAEVDAAAARFKAECELVAERSRTDARARVEAELAPRLGALLRRAEAAEAHLAQLEPMLAATQPATEGLVAAPSEPTSSEPLTGPEPALPASSDAEAARPSRPWRAAKGMALLALLGGAMVAAGVWALEGGWFASVVTRPAAHPERNAALSAADEPLVDHAPRDAPAVARCPVGTLQVEAASFRLRPPPGREGWPAPREGADPHVEVDAFCIDRQPVSKAMAKARQPCQGNPQVFKDGEPATCISRYEAAAVCEQLGGGLPTIAQWEVIARSDVVEELAWHLDREWVADSFPPAIFEMDHARDDKHDALFRKRRLRRPEQDGVLWSWNRHDGSARWTHFGFRCAHPLGSG